MPDGINYIFDARRDTLADSSTLIALLLSSDNAQKRVRAALETLPAGGLLVTVWPVLTEAAHFLGKAGGWYAQARLQAMVVAGPLRIYAPRDADSHFQRVFALMDQYSNLPCDLADAALVACGEETGLSRILTLDSHFFAYRTVNGDAFVVLPGPAG